MKKLFMAGAALVGAAWMAGTGCVGDQPLPNGLDASTDGSAKACSKPSDCGSGFCVDGVCCDSACGGTCEACNVPGSVGKCSPVPDGEDPGNECAGLTDGGVSDDGGTITQDAAINVPDGGVTLDSAKCGGKCNGKRACAFADNTVTCGSVFCNDTTTQGRAACDGQGQCELAIETCKAYSCPDGTGDAGAANGCLKTCTGESDCLPTHYCSGGKCEAKLANGSVCGSVPQCQSGHCVSGVCCNDECQGVGGSCTTSGKVGQCICPACPNGSCSLWYKDGDNDGYGDSTGTLGNGRAIAGCTTAPDGGVPTPPQPGFVQNNTDCFDGLAAVHPGQTAYFTTPYGPNNSFDYNCDNAISKSVQEYVGGSCGFCTGTSCSKVTTCTTKASPSFHACAPKGKYCLGQAASAFHTTVPCGVTSTQYNCGSCGIAGSQASVTTSAVAQSCH